MKMPRIKEYQMCMNKEFEENTDSFYLLKTDGEKHFSRCVNQLGYACFSFITENIAKDNATKYLEATRISNEFIESLQKIALRIYP